MFFIVMHYAYYVQYTIASFDSPKAGRAVRCKDHNRNKDIEIYLQ